ncbi:DEAD/DEAH box helicase [Pelomonas sp. CA6]|uniref:DEAD/DEAH box helicase n=1 Tax=Pelomonas sp. CA6 TaxID=2907999 RepID=UPI001F4BE539|nr:DEAD/DEAH box helicase [Pelomonas sp. CA6]MCH7345060.1 DEAD/DEAH box helicase [Pelomonas sp. CA6]
MSFDHEIPADAAPQEASETPDTAVDPRTPAFATLGLHESLLRAVKDAGYEQATEVQGRAIPPALEGADLMVSSRTGSGKTASFILPALQQVLLARGDGKRRDGGKGRVQGPRVLVLAPTRELAMQVAKSAQTYGRHIQGLRVATVLGGMPYAQQIRMLSGPLDILIATPGRLMDHITSGKCTLANVSMFVLDEADRMLDMGFIEDIEFVAQHLPEQRQTLMYSATFAGNTGRLAAQLMKEPQRIDVSGHTETHENIEQRLHWADNGMHKRKLLEHILAARELDQAVVFTSTQQDAEWLAGQLAEIGHRVAPLHGGMPQGKRNRTLMALRRRDLRVLVATDVAARGIDVPTISHVVNFGLPMKAEDYVHRIGRTGRAGRSGLAITLAERQDLMMIKRIQQFTTQPIPVARIDGLEPRMEEPRIFPPRPAGDRGGRGGRFGDRASGFGQEGGWRGPRPDARGDRRHDPRFDGPREERRFDAPRGEGRGRPQGEGRFEPRQEQQRFDARPEGRFNKPRFEGREGGPRGFGERAPERGFQRDQGAPRGHFGDRPRFERAERPQFERGGDRPQFDRGERGGFAGKPAFGGERRNSFDQRPEGRSFAPRGEGNRGGQDFERRGPGKSRPGFGDAPRKGGFKR